MVSKNLARKKDLRLQKRIREQLEQTQLLVDKALEVYGEPTMTLEELRERLDAELGDISLCDLIIKERHAQP